jgi:hypothetical protein
MPTEDLENELRGAFAKTAAELPHSEQARQRLLQRDYRPASRRRRSIVGLSVGVSVAGVVTAVVLAVTMLAPSGPPASHPAPAQLAAWTVIKQSGGAVTITIREFRDPAGLQAKLRADGVPASVIFYPNKLKHNVPFRDLFRVAHNPCREFPDQSKLLKVIPPKHTGPLQGSTTITIIPSALPNRAGVQFISTTNLNQNVSGRHALGVWLVDATHQCTGS